MAFKRLLEATLISALVTVAPLAHAQSSAAPKKPAEPSGDPGPTTEVRTGSTWAATDEVERAPEGGATLRPRLVLPSDFGTWAYTPAAFGAFTVRVTGGEIALTSHLSLVLEGADDMFDHRFSGMASGLRLHLLPFASSLQLSLAGGITQDLSGERGLWSQLAVSQELGRWHFASALRASSLSSGLATEQSLDGSAGVAFDLQPVRLGLEYALAHDRNSRSAVLPWVAVPTNNQHVTLRAGPVLPLHGANAFPARVSIAGDF
jgi:hypothetical protein